MFLLLFSFSSAFDVKNIIKGEWLVYPGSIHTYSPVQKYLLSIFDDDYEQITFATVWNPSNAPTSSKPSPPENAMISETRIFFQGPNRGLFVTGEDRHWVAFTFHESGSRRVCNITHRNGYKIGLFFQTEKTVEFTLTNPKGEIEQQYLCFAKNQPDTTYVEKYILKRYQAEKNKALRMNVNVPVEEDNEEAEVEEIQNDKETQGVRITSLNQVSVPLPALLAIIGIVFVIQIFLIRK